MSLSKAAAIEFYTDQLIAAENEQKKLQKVLARLSQLDAKIQAIKLLRAEQAGGGSTDPLPRASKLPEYAGPELSVASLVRRALDEAGKPQKTEQLLAFLASHGKPTSSATLRSTIYQYTKKGKQFKRIAPGLYGVIEGH